MTYYVDLNLLNSLVGCKHGFQRGDSYCAVGKIGVCAIKKHNLQYIDYFSGDVLFMDDDFGRFIEEIKTAIGAEALREIMTLNDKKGTMAETHDAALARLVHLLEETGVIRVGNKTRELCPA